ncbi:hypothetical protein DFH06DRAFT_1430038 [Mycena polygramma]|nr:hypothetical protein DFH06DRAFT_1430038 [Mycena polygramma]
MSGLESELSRGGYRSTLPEPLRFCAWSVTSAAIMERTGSIRDRMCSWGMSASVPGVGGHWLYAPGVVDNASMNSRRRAAALHAVSTARRARWVNTVEESFMDCAVFFSHHGEIRGWKQHQPCMRGRRKNPQSLSLGNGRLGTVHTKLVGIKCERRSRQFLDELGRGWGAAVDGVSVNERIDSWEVLSWNAKMRARSGTAQEPHHLPRARESQIEQHIGRVSTRYMITCLTCAVNRDNPSLRTSASARLGPNPATKEHEAISLVREERTGRMRCRGRRAGGGGDVGGSWKKPDVRETLQAAFTDERLSAVGRSTSIQWRRGCERTSASETGEEDGNAPWDDESCEQEFSGHGSMRAGRTRLEMMGVKSKRVQNKRESGWPFIPSPAIAEVEFRSGRVGIPERKA